MEETRWEGQNFSEDVALQEEEERPVEMWWHTAETRFHLLAKRTNPFKSAGVSIRLTTGSRGVHISGSNTANTMFWGSVKGTDYPLHLPVSP
jgi:hypothetical protein